MFTQLTLREKILKKIGPTRILALSFLLVILTGAVLLSLPISNVDGNSFNFLDSLFVATSSTCVTGLVPVALVNQFNIFGHTVIIFLMQIGGLGLMTMIALILTFMRQRLHYNEKKLIQDSLNKDNVQDIPKFLKSIFKYTFTFEGIGVLLFMCKLVPEYGFAKGLYNSVFLSVSAFCNAGLDNMTSTSLMKYAGDPLISLTVCALIILGGLGFVVWFDYSTKIKKVFKRELNPKKIWKALSVQTRLVTLMTVGLLLSGTVIIFLLEHSNGTMVDLSFSEKLIASFFESTTLRTAGFSTIDYTGIRLGTQMVMILFMYIGGSPGGTSGGIKTTTMAILFLSIYSSIKNREHITLFKRTIPNSVFHRAFTIATGYICALFIAVFILSLSENQSFIALLFEAVSAIATVGLSLGITAALSPVGKIVIIVLMFIGRVGPITILLSFMKNKQKHKGSDINYPQGDVMIG